MNRNVGTMQKRFIILGIIAIGALVVTQVVLSMGSFKKTSIELSPEGRVGNLNARPSITDTNLKIKHLEAQLAQKDATIAMLSAKHAQSAFEGEDGEKILYLARNNSDLLVTLPGDPSPPAPKIIRRGELGSLETSTSAASN